MLYNTSGGVVFMTDKIKIKVSSFVADILENDVLRFGFTKNDKSNKNARSKKTAKGRSCILLREEESNDKKEKIKISVV